MTTLADTVRDRERVMSELEIEGECDKCDATYDIGSRDNRCGDCGNCGNCCTHKEVA